MILGSTFYPSCQAFAQLSWMQFRRHYVQMLVLTISAILLADVGFLSQQGEGLAGWLRFWPVYLAGVAVFCGCFFFGSKLSSALGSSEAPGVTVYAKIQQYTLPIPTTDLVLAPMLVSVLSVSVFWWAFCLLSGLPTHANVPVFVGWLVLVLVVCSGYANFWAIRRGTLYGCFCTFIGILSPLWVGYAFQHKWPQWMVSLLALASSGIAVWIALTQAPFVRHGVERISDYRRARLRSSQSNHSQAVPERAKFRSVLQTQIWCYEAQGFQKVILYLLGVVTIILLVRIPLSDPVPRVFIGIGDIRISQSAFQCWWVIPGASYLALFFGGVTNGNFTMKDGKFVRGIPQFLAIRPAPTLTISAAQLLANLRVCIWTSVLLVASLIPWGFLSPAIEKDVQRPLWVLLFGHATARGILFACVLLALLPLLISIIPIVSQTTSLLPDRFKKLYSVFGAIAFGATYGLISGFGQVSQEGFSEWLPQMLLVAFGLFCVKAILIQIAVSRLLRHGLLSRGQFLSSCGIWVGTVAMITAALALLQPPGYLPLPFLLLLVALLIPANRFLWHVDLLDRTRHS